MLTFGHALVELAATGDAELAEKCRTAFRQYVTITRRGPDKHARRIPDHKPSGLRPKDAMDWKKRGDHSVDIGHASSSNPKLETRQPLRQIAAAICQPVVVQSTTFGPNRGNRRKFAQFTHWPGCCILPAQPFLASRSMTCPARLLAPRGIVSCRKSKSRVSRYA